MALDPAPLKANVFGNKPGIINTPAWITWLTKLTAKTVTGVDATAPVISSGGTDPTISIPAANASANGYLTAADWANLPSANQKAALAGTDGTPSNTNRYVTDSDPRWPELLVSDIFSTAAAGVETKTITFGKTYTVSTTPVLLTLLQDNFTDTDAVLLKNHTPDINNTGDVWHDANDRYKILSNQCVKNSGGDDFTTYINLGRNDYVATVTTVIPAGTFDQSIVFRKSGTNFLRIQIHSSAGIRLLDQAGSIISSSAYTPATGAKVCILTLTSSHITFSLGGVTYLDLNNSTGNTRQEFGFARWSGSTDIWDSLTIAYTANVTSNPQIQLTPVVISGSDMIFPFVSEINAANVVVGIRNHGANAVNCYLNVLVISS